MNNGVYTITIPSTERITQIFESHKIETLLTYYTLVKPITLTDFREDIDKFKIEHYHFVTDRTNREERKGTKQIRGINEIRKFFNDNTDLNTELIKYWNNHIRRLTDKILNDYHDSTIMYNGDYFTYETIYLVITLDGSNFKIELRSMCSFENFYQDVIKIPFTSKQIELLKRIGKHYSYVGAHRWKDLSERDVEYKDGILIDNDEIELKNIKKRLDRYFVSKEFRNSIVNKIKEERGITNVSEHITAHYGFNHFEYNNCIKQYEQNESYLNFRDLNRVGNDDEYTSDLGDGGLSFDGDNLLFKIKYGYSVCKRSFDLDYTKETKETKSKNEIINPVLLKVAKWKPKYELGWGSKYPKFNNDYGIMNKRLDKLQEKYFVPEEVL